MLGIGSLAQLALAEFPQKPVSGVSSVSDNLTISDVFNAVRISTVSISETLLFVDITNASIATSGHICVQYISPPISVGQSAVAQIPCVALVQVAPIDTHDGGFVKKKKKKKNIDTFEEELERTAKLRKDITEVIHPPVLVPVEEPETKPVPEVVETKPFEIKTKITPAVDYAGLAQQEIVDKLRLDAEAKQMEFLHQLELKRLADIEDEDELEMILEALL